jgi:hypothetical protein
MNSNIVFITGRVFLIPCEEAQRLGRTLNEVITSGAGRDAIYDAERDYFTHRNGNKTIQRCPRCSRWQEDQS